MRIVPKWFVWRRMRFSLRTLIVIMLLGGPLCAWGWREVEAYRARQREAKFDELVDLITTTVVPESWDGQPSSFESGCHGMVVISDGD